MSDIFAGSDVNFGGDYDPFQSTEADSGTPEPVDNGSTEAADSTAPTDDTATAVDQGTQDLGTQQEPTAPTGDQNQPAQPTEEDLAKMEQEADTVLADPKTPKWFKNVVENVYKPKLTEIGKQVEQYSALGSPEELSEKIGLMSKLGETRRDPITGMPITTTEGFVKGLHETRPELTVQLMQDLASLPAPDGSGQTIIQALFNGMGIDPNRISDIQSFAQNGYQLQASQYAPPDPGDLALIPQHLQATFAKLDPDTRESLLSDSDHVRDRNLETWKFRLETEERQQAEEQARVQNEQQQQAQQQAQFRQQIDAKTEENFAKAGEAVLNSFVESLAKNTGMSELDSVMIATTVLTSFEPTLAGQKALGALKAAGIEIDPSMQETITQLQESANFTAYYELVGDQPALQKEVARQVELQSKLTAKGQKVIAALAVKRNGSVITPARKVSDQLANTVNQNSYATAAGVPHTGGSPLPADRNFSDQSYEDAIAADPFFRR